MLWRTHVLAGASAGLLIAGPGADLKTMVLSAGVAGLGALLPDIDSPNSKIGRKVPILPILLTITVGHRGMLHSVPGALLLSMLTATVANVFLITPFLTLFLLFLTGYLSHIFLDMLTPRGCPLLWPLPFNIRIPLVQTGGLAEKLIIFPVTGIFFAWLAFPIIKDAFIKLV